MRETQCNKYPQKLIDSKREIRKVTKERRSIKSVSYKQKKKEKNVMQNVTNVMKKIRRKIAQVKKSWRIIVVNEIERE